MSPQRWRAIALLSIVACVGLVCGDIVALSAGGDFGFTFTGTTSSTVVRSVAPAGPAGRAGIAVGDRIAPDPYSLHNRVELVSTRSGDIVHLRVSRGAAVRHLRLVAEGGSATGLSYGVALVFETLRLTMLAVAGLLALRRPERRDARTLASFFILFAYFLLQGTPWYPDPIRAVVLLTREVALFVSFGLLAQFAALFPSPAQGGARESLRRLAWTIVCIDMLPIGAGAFGLALGWGSLPGWVAGASFASAVVILIATAASFAIGYREADLGERARGRWLLLSLGVGLGGLLIGAGLEFAGAPEFWAVGFALCTILMPLGVAYSILRHRLLDVAFVVNRALVFTIVSAIVVAAFGALEFVLGNVLVRAGHVTSVALQLALALVLGVSLRGIHSRVDSFADRVFFRERNDALRALRRFAREAPYITGQRILAERTVANVDRYTRVAGSALYFADGGVYSLRNGSLLEAPGDVDANDAAVLALLADREPLDLPLEGSALHGAAAYPMLVRGELAGILVCGGKPEGQSDDPSEREAVVAIAAAIAVADELLRVRALIGTVDAFIAGQASTEQLRAARNGAASSGGR